MKAVVCLMCLAVVAANPMGGRYVLTYDNSLENGVREASLEWIPGRSAGAPVSLKSANAAGSPFPMRMNADSSEELMMYMLGDNTKPVARTRSQKVQDLTRMLNSGYMDRSDEHMLRAVMNNPERFGNRPYYVDNSGEVNFLPHGFRFGAGGSAGGARGSGVQAA